MANPKLIGQLANPAATIVCAGLLYLSDLSTQRQIKEVKNELQEEIKAVRNEFDWKINKLQGQINEVKNELKGQINEVHNELAKGINQAQFLATGAPLIFINDPRKIPVMQERLRVFGACVRGGGGESCIQAQSGK